MRTGFAIIPFPCPGHESTAKQHHRIFLPVASLHMNITCIDFETANQSRTSVCAIGLAHFKNGILMQSSHQLVQPPRGHGWFIPEWTARIHGISWLNVQNAPQFPEIAASFLERLVSADLVIAHTAAFDMSVLSAVLDHYHLRVSPFRYLCTMQLAQRIWPHLPDHRLDTLTAHISIPLQHHHAESDATAAGHLFFALQQGNGSHQHHTASSKWFRLPTLHPLPIVKVGKTLAVSASDIS